MPILQDFTPQDIIHIVNHSESRLLFLGDNYRDSIEEDQIPLPSRTASSPWTDFAYHLRTERQIADRIPEEPHEELPGEISARLQRQRHQIPRDSERPSAFAEPHRARDRIPPEGVMLTCEQPHGQRPSPRPRSTPRPERNISSRGGRTLPFLLLATMPTDALFDFWRQLAFAHITSPLLGRIPDPRRC